MKKIKECLNDMGREMGKYKKNIRRTSAVLLAGAVVLTGSQSYMLEARAQSEYEDAEQDVLTELIGNQTFGQTKSGNASVDKEETVYLITDATGNVEQTIVSDWLKNPEGKQTLSDASDLSGIENVKGDETFTAEGGDGILWNANGNDIYYQGTTNEEAPVDVKISYYLDGNEISPEELAGKSGNVKIRFDYTNNEIRTEEVGGNEEELHVPFTVVSAMFLPVDKFSNVEVTNGKVVSDGSRNIVVGVALPGLMESLDPEGKAREEIDKRIEDGSETIPDYVEVNADVNDFALDMTVSVAMPDLISDFNMAGDIDLSGIDDSMDKLNDAAAKLTNGTGELKNGADKLSDGGKTLKDGAEKLNGGIGEYTNGVSKLTGGLGQLKDGSGKLANGAAQVSGGLGQLFDGLNGMKGSLDAGIAEQQKNKEALTPKVEGDKAAVTGAVTDFGTNIANASATAAAGKAAEVAGAAAANAAANATAPIAAEAAASAAANAAATSAASAAAGSAAEAAAGAAANAAVTAALTTYQNGIAQAVAAYVGDPANGVAGDPSALNALAGKMQAAATGAVTEELVAGAVGAKQADIAAAAGNAAAGAVTPELISGAVGAKQADIAAAAGNAATSAVTGAMSDPNTQAAIAQAAGSAATAVSSEGVTQAVTQLATDAGSLGGAVGAETALSTIQSKTDLSKLTDLVNGAEELANGAATLDQGMATAYNGAMQLDNASGELRNGSAKLANGAGELSNGIDKLDAGAGKLNDGLAQFDEEGLQRITEAVDGDLSQTVDRIGKVMELSRDYDTFTRLAEGQTGKVKFIYRTGAIK